jgi:hypothetical protein
MADLNQIRTGISKAANLLIPRNATTTFTHDLGVIPGIISIQGRESTAVQFCFVTAATNANIQIQNTAVGTDYHADVTIIAV